MVKKILVAEGFGHCDDIRFEDVKVPTIKVNSYYSTVRYGGGLEHFEIIMPETCKQVESGVWAKWRCGRFEVVYIPGGAEDPYIGRIYFIGEEYEGDK